MAPRVGKGDVFFILGIGLCALSIILIRRHRKRLRESYRQRYWVHFWFAGGGTSTGRSFAEVDRDSYAISTQTTEMRNADYSVWSYNEEWHRRFFEAVNEARIAREAR